MAILRRILFAEKDIPSTELSDTRQNRRPNAFIRFLFAENGLWTNNLSHETHEYPKRLQSSVKVNFSDTVTNGVRKDIKLLDATFDGRTDKIIFRKKSQHCICDSPIKSRLDETVIHNLEEEQEHDIPSHYIAVYPETQEESDINISRASFPISHHEENRNCIDISINSKKHQQQQSNQLGKKLPSSPNKTVVANMSVTGPSLSTLNQPQISRRSPDRHRPKTADVITPSQEQTGVANFHFDEKSISSGRSKKHSIFARHSSMKRKPLAVLTDSSPHSNTDTIDKTIFTTPLKKKDMSVTGTRDVTGPSLALVSPSPTHNPR